MAESNSNECNCYSCLLKRAGKPINELDPFTKKKLQNYFRRTYDEQRDELTSQAAKEFGKMLGQAMASGLSVQESMEAVRAHFRALIEVWGAFLEMQPIILNEAQLKDLQKKKE